MACCLYPFTIGKIVDKGGHIWITYQARTACPEKGLLLMLKPAAEKMIMAWAKKALPGAEEIRIGHEWIYTRLKKKLIN